MNNKGADQTAQMGRLVCAFVVLKPLKKGFLTSMPIYSQTADMPRTGSAPKTHGPLPFDGKEGEGCKII